jgi:hypothetical protein
MKTIKYNLIDLLIWFSIYLLISCRDKNLIKENAGIKDEIFKSSKNDTISNKENKIDSIFNLFTPIQVNDSIVDYIKNNEKLIKHLYIQNEKVLNESKDTLGVVNENIYFFDYSKDNNIKTDVAFYRKILYDINKEYFIKSRNVSHKFLSIKDTIAFINESKLEINIFEDEDYYAHKGIKCYPVFINVEKDKKIFLFYFDKLRMKNKTFYFTKETRNSLIEYKFTYLPNKNNFNLISFSRPPAPQSVPTLR